MPPRRRALPLLAVLSLGACAPPAPVAGPTPTPVPTTTPAPAAAPAPQPVAPVVAAPPHDPELVASDAVAESLLVDVTRVDSTIRVELRYATPYNFMGEVLPGYEAPRALLRREAAAALARVQARLHADGGGLALKVFDAYRPVRASAAMVAWTRRVRREDLVRDGYVAERGPHDQGLAVDVTLVAAGSGRELKMGTAFDTFAPAARTDNATGEFAANRQRLRRAMEAEGFANVPAEWWHYRYTVPDPMRFDLVIR
jgi:zinc D-Ala-D-Ala dipeptidase